MKRAAVTAVMLALLTACGSSSSPQAGPNTKTTTPSATTPTTTANPSGSPSPPTSYRTPPPTLPVPGWNVTMSTGPAPWPAPVLVGNGAESLQYVYAAGLPALGQEMLAIHYHVHLDVDVNGQQVPVPAYLGYVLVNKKVGLAPLHTHDASGVIHIENDHQADFLLGEVFVEWGVRFSSTCLGAYCAGGSNELGVFVNGQRQSGDPTRIVLHKHDEIAVEFGPSGKLPTPSASYHFSNGL